MKVILVCNVTSTDPCYPRPPSPPSSAKSANFIQICYQENVQILGISGKSQKAYYLSLLANWQICLQFIIRKRTQNFLSGVISTDTCRPPTQTPLTKFTTFLTIYYQETFLKLY